MNKESYYCVRLQHEGRFCNVLKKKTSLQFSLQEKLVWRALEVETFFGVALFARWRTCPAYQKSNVRLLASPESWVSF